MDTRTMEAMAQRLERLERECRRWRRAGMAAVLVGAIALLVGGSPRDDGPKTVEAERFLLKDKDGTIRGEWRLWPDGPEFRLNSKGGRRHLSLTVVEGAGRAFPMALLRDEKGAARLVMSLSISGSPLLSFHDKDGKPILQLPVAAPLPPPMPPPGP
jgi:hypothetical protein